MRLELGNLLLGLAVELDELLLEILPQRGGVALPDPPAVALRQRIAAGVRLTTAGSARLGAKRFEDIDFITYRSASPGTVACGPLPSPVRVLTTYRPSETAASSGSVLGDLVAVELLPDDYTPRLTPGEDGANQR